MQALAERARGASSRPRLERLGRRSAVWTDDGVPDVDAALAALDVARAARRHVACAAAGARLKDVTQRMVAAHAVDGRAHGA